MGMPAIGSTPAKVIQTAVTTAKGSNVPTTGSAQDMLNKLPNKHPISPSDYK